MIKKISLWMFLVLSLFAASSFVSSQQAHAAPTDTWVPVWSDEFDGTSGAAPDTTKWSYDIGTGANNDGWGNQEKEYYTDRTANCFLDGNGKLILKALQETYGSGSQQRNYTSCRMVTKSKGDWKYGRVEVMAKLPTGGLGIWPAIWMLPSDKVYGNWPRSGEIDMMEMVGAEPLKVYGTIHYGNPWLHTGGDYTLPNNGFHEYAVEWDEEEIRWYVDDVLFSTKKVDDWYSSNSPKPGPFDQRFHLLLNLAVGGTWPGTPDASTVFPQQMEVDYVRVYERPGTWTKPLPGKIEAESYASMSGVSVEATTDTGNGKNVASIQTSDTLTYNAAVKTTGSYTMEYRVANGGTSNASFNLLVDGVQQGTTVTVPPTGGNQQWTTLTQAVTLNAGNHTLQVSGASGDFRLNWLQAVKLNTVIAEDFENWDNNALFGSSTSGSSTITLSKDTASKTQGNYALKVDYNQASGGALEWYSKFYQNWSYHMGMKLDVLGQSSGRTVRVELEDAEGERYDYDFVDNFTGWNSVVMPFSSFVRASTQPSGAPNDGLDRKDLNGVHIQMLTAGAGTLYFDNLIVYSGSPTSTPEPKAVPPVITSAIPGVVEAESYGAMSGVKKEDTQDVGGGQNIGYINTGDWLDYNVNVAQTGAYKVEYRVASANGSSGFELRSGSAVLDSHGVSPTGGSQVWQTMTDYISLSAGSQVIRLYAVGSSFNINWIQFTKVDPIKIEAEAYTTMNGVQTQTTTDTGGGLNVAYIDPGDWMDYTVTLPRTATYKVEYRVASANTTGAFQLMEGSTVLDSQSVPNTGGTQKWITQSSGSIQLTAGTHTFRIYSNGNHYNLNWFQLLEQ
ncbi:carbohydrate-binding protein [Paenibacillus cremeus]|uniref:Carbohydrate-binding protein n=1 Tax=Paenibacillus cremeus TaxID=2163881 RepID=A0A559KBG0_9BACL|nr:carbohydrate-binding protein [Paenibacillus cremeus]TVY09465.1 carbohydrate-binding protein [Paenibacillus cremeus]